jgi:phosphatidylinositol 4-kinase
LVHIDFGFILEISPGGNMGFESAAFKLSHEMTQLLDPGNTRQSSHFKLFEQLCIRGYLVVSRLGWEAREDGSREPLSHNPRALLSSVSPLRQARTIAEPIIATVALMAESGLPCFGRGAPIDNLRKRFHLEMTDRQAAVFMRQTIADSYQKWTTGVYDAIQGLQNRIPF